MHAAVVVSYMLHTYVYISVCALSRGLDDEAKRHAREMFSAQSSERACKRARRESERVAVNFKIEFLN